MDNLDRERHIRYLLASLKGIPGAYASLDSNRITLVYFVISSLDVLGELDRVTNKKEIIDFVYSLQIVPDATSPEHNFQNCGFRGSSFFGQTFNPSCTPGKMFHYDQSHVAMTYTALLLLRILGDDFSRINKPAIVRAIKTLQLEDGSICCIHGGESDMRFIFTACAVSAMLNDWGGLDKDKLFSYIISSQSYDAGIAQGPLQESHGGSTYCAIASLHLMGRLSDLPRKDELVKWCLERQVSGFQGRINKDADTCYSFWIGASLHLLGYHTFVDFTALHGHTMSCQQGKGGFSKLPGTYSDPLHTYFSLCGLTLGGEPGLLPIDCGLGLTERASGDWLVNRRVAQHTVL